MAAAPVPAAPGPRSRAAVVLAAASFGSLGACLTLWGTLLPVVVSAFGIRLVEAGSMLALQPAGYLLAVVGSNRAIARLGVRGTTSVGLLVFGAGTAGFGLARGWHDGGAMLFLSGLGFGLLEVAGNALIVMVAGARRMNVLNLVHLFFGVGAFVAPAATAGAVTAGASWHHLFIGAGVATALVGAAWGLVPAVAPASPAAVPVGVVAGRVRGVFPLRWLVVTIGLYVGVETGLGAWLTKYEIGVRGTSLAVAGTVLSGYWLGLAAGRLALSVLAHRVGEAELLRALAAASAVALAAALVLPGVLASSLCFMAVGAAFSGIFPALIALGGQAGDDPAPVTQRLIVGAGVGTIVVPWLMSAVADAFGLVAGMAFYAAMAAVMAATAVAVHRTWRAFDGVPADGRPEPA